MKQEQYNNGIKELIKSFKDLQEKINSREVSISILNKRKGEMYSYLVNYILVNESIEYVLNRVPITKRQLENRLKKDNWKPIEAKFIEFHLLNSK